MNKREFIRNAMLAAGGSLISDRITANTFRRAFTSQKKKEDGGLTLRFTPYTLQLRHTFTLASNSRTTTPVVLTEIGYDGLTGYGEASMPPYLGESHESVLRFLSLLNISQFRDPFLTADILDYVTNAAPGNFAAKASVDIALHDLIGKLLGKPEHVILGLNPARTPATSFTIGLDSPDIVRQKVAEAEPYRILKVKLGRDNDRQMIEVIRSCTGKPLCADVNQGWKDRHYALEMAGWLREKGVIYLEQPMPKDRTDDIAWLTAQSPIPVIGDEAVQNAADLVRQRDVYSGVNIKLMKCGGISGALMMIDVARALGMKVMIGCMTETSCAVTAAAQLSPLADWCDLDGNLLISNDPFEGVRIVEGRIILPPGPGIGIRKTGPA